jgi:hypothetical protein
VLCCNPAQNAHPPECVADSAFNPGRVSPLEKF